MRAYATLQKLLCHETIANLSSVLREHRAGCRLPPALLLTQRNQSPDVVRSRNLSESTLARDAVTAAVSRKHRSIICVGAGLIQFVYGSHSMQRFALRFGTRCIHIPQIFVHVCFARQLINKTIKCTCVRLPISKDV